jgi:hypothetical protein
VACLDCVFKIVFLPNERQWQVLFLEIVIYLDNEMFSLIRFNVGYAVVEAMCYEPEGRGFDS